MQILTPAESLLQFEMEDMKKLRKLKQSLRNEGFNRGVRAAAKIAEVGWDWGTVQREQADRIAAAILKLQKPRKTSHRKSPA